MVHCIFLSLLFQLLHVNKYSFRDARVSEVASWTSALQSRVSSAPQVPLSGNRLIYSPKPSFRGWTLGWKDDQCADFPEACLYLSFGPFPGCFPPHPQLSVGTTRSKCKRLRISDSAQFTALKKKASSLLFYRHMFLGQEGTLKIFILKYLRASFEMKAGKHVGGVHEPKILNRGHPSPDFSGCLPAQNFSSSQMAKPSRRCFILMSVRRIVLFWWKRLPEHTGGGTAVHTPSCPLRTDRRRELLRRQCHRTAGPWQRPETEITPCRCPHLVQSPN